MKHLTESIRSGKKRSRLTLPDSPEYLEEIVDWLEFNKFENVTASDPLLPPAMVMKGKKCYQLGQYDQSPVTHWIMVSDGKNLCWRIHTTNKSPIPLECLKIGAIHANRISWKETVRDLEKIR